MGYTHNWYQTEIPKENFSKLVSATKMVLELCEVPIANAWGEIGTHPDINEKVISFNGVGDDSHETFYLERTPTPEYEQGSGDRSFGFCKTNGKPYDTVVTAVLCLADLYCRKYIKIESDGDAIDWKDGLELAQMIRPEAEIPDTVQNRT